MQEHQADNDDDADDEYPPSVPWQSGKPPRRRSSPPRSASRSRIVPTGFVVQQGIDLPKEPVKDKRVRSPWVSFLQKMQLGDSVFVPDATVARLSHVRKIAEKYGMAVEIRQQADGARLWRVAAQEDDGL